MTKSTATLAASIAAGTLLLAGCASSSGASKSSASSATPASATDAAGKAGTVRVLYAGSLVNLMKDVTPAFAKADGGDIQGKSAGSDALVSDIKGKIDQGDVFISASTGANDGLVGKSNGDWESWNASFATAPLVLGYNPKSKFAQQLKTKPWYDVVDEPGFRLGSTDPKLDPKGKLAAQALKDAKIPTTKTELFPEEQLLARMNSGNLDAGFFYSSEAGDAHIPTIPLGKIHLQAQYTVTVLNKAPNAAGAQDFVKYLLGPSGKALLTKHGFTVTGVKVSGDTAGVPADLRSTLGLS